MFQTIFLTPFYIFNHNIISKEHNILPLKLYLSTETLFKIIVSAIMDINCIVIDFLLLIKKTNFYMYTYFIVISLSLVLLPRSSFYILITI